MSEFYSEFKGTCPVDRRLFEMEWFCKLSYAEKYLAFFLLVEANYEDRPSNGLKTVVKRGEWIGSVGNEKRPGTLIERTGIPYSTLCDCIKKLEKVGFLKKDAKSGRFTRFIIPEYDKLTGKTDRSTDKKGNKKSNKDTDSNKEIEEVQEEDNSTVYIDWGDD